MRSLNFLQLCIILATPSLASAHPARLNITAVAAHNGTSHFECWELDSPFSSSNQSGLVDTRTASLGDVSEMTYNIVPAGFDGGFHPAPSNQWVVLLSGLAVITLPDNTSTTIAANGGGFGLVFATDTADRTRRGHGSIFPGGTESIALQIPTKNGGISKHRVLYHDKPCTTAEVAGLRAWAVGN